MILGLKKVIKKSFLVVSVGMRKRNMMVMLVIMNIVNTWVHGYEAIISRENALPLPMSPFTNYIMVIQSITVITKIF